MKLFNRRAVIASIAGLFIGLSAAKEHPAQAASGQQAPSLDDLLGGPFGPLPVQPHPVPTQPDPQHMTWVAQALGQMQTVHVGLTRAQMASIFERAGGSYAARGTAPLLGVYSYRQCPYFKVNVEFQPVNKPQRDASGSVWTPEDPQDVITKISKPFVEQVYYD